MNSLFFTAGIPGPTGMLEDHGLFGSISTTPEPGTAGLLIGVFTIGAGFTLLRRRFASIV